MTYDTSDASLYGFAALAEFTPHRVKTPPATAQVEITNPAFSGFVYDYREVVEDLLARPEPRASST